MAFAVQTVVATPLLRPLHWNGERPPWAPKAQLIFIAQDQTVDAIGAADTGGFILQFPLPSNASYVLQRMMISHRGGNFAMSWDSPSFAMWYGLPGSPVGDAIEIRQSCSQTTFHPAVSASVSESYYTYGVGDRIDTTSAANVDQIRGGFVDTLILNGGYPDANSPQFNMWEPDASIGITEIAYVCIFNQYDENASLEAMFHANNPMGQPG